MMRNRHNEATEHNRDLKVRENRKVTQKRLQDQESEEAIQEALRQGSGSEYLEDSDNAENVGNSLGDFDRETE